MEIRCLSTLDAMAIAEKTKHGWLCTTNLLADENCSIAVNRERMRGQLTTLAEEKNVSDCLAYQ